MTMPLSMLLGHLRHVYTCPYCQKIIRGNGFYNHKRACLLKKVAAAPRHPAT